MSVTNTVTDLRAILGMGEAAGSALISRDYTYYPWTTSVKGGYLQSAVSTNQAAVTLQNLSYDYEPGGNISSILDGVSGELSSFTYDALSRLTSMTVTAGASTTHSEAFTYDAGTGNLAGKGPDLQNLAVYGYDATHPHAAASLGSNAYTYDANGNQVTRSVAEGIFNLEYDAENHLVGMAPEGGLRMQMSTEPTKSPVIEPTLTQMVEPTATETLEPTETETATPTETPSETAPAEQAEAVGETSTETPVETRSEGATATPEAAIETPTAEPTAELSVTVEPLDSTKIPLNLEETGEEPESLILGVESLESAIYIYDGDGTMVKSIINGVMTYYPGRHYNLSMDGETESIQKSYAFGSLTIATRKDGVLRWVLGDHLGSTSLTANADGTFFSELRYSAFGEIRYSSGTTPTDYRYTNQLSQESTGLYYYVARWYDPELARFIQADNIVPDKGLPITWDRYAYVRNNPILYNDPSGNDVGCAGRDASKCANQKPIPYSKNIDTQITKKNNNIISESHSYVVQNGGGNTIISLFEQETFSAIPQSMTTSPRSSSQTHQTTKEHTVTPSATPSSLPTRTNIFTATASYATPSPEQITKEGESVQDLVVNLATDLLDQFDINSVPETYPLDILSPFENISPESPLVINAIRVVLTTVVSTWNLTPSMHIPVKTASESGG